MQLGELLDINELRGLCESFTALTGAVTAVLDLEGNILVATGWQDICTRFHRINPLTADRCRESDTVLASRLEQGNSYNVYRCKNGLVDVAVPILVGGKHVGNFFTGQFFLEAPDQGYFARQAKEFGFNEDAYLGALKRAPVFSEEHVRSIMAFFTRLAKVMGEMGLARLRLQEKNAELQASAAIIQSSEDAIIGKSLDGTVTSWNPAAENLFGYTAAEIIGKPIGVLFPPGRLGEEDAILAQLKRGEIVKHFDTERLRKDGTRISLSVSISPIRGVDGKIIGASKIARDITERKRIQDVLSRNERYQRALLDNFPFAVWLKDTESRFLAVNEGFTRIFGGDITGLTGKTDFDIAPPDLAERYREDDRAVMDSREKKNVEEEIVDAGVRKWFETYKAPVIDGAGALLGTVGFARDITERRAAQLALDRERSFLRTLIDTLPDLVWLKNIEGVYLACNHRFEQFFGACEAEIVGKTDYDFVDKTLADFFRQKDRLAMEQDEASVNEEEVVFALDGHREFLETTKMPMRDAQGNLVGILGIGHDITQRKATDRELELHRQHLQELVDTRTAALTASKEAAEAANISKSAFLANMSHEIRTPLNAITGMAHLMKRSGVTPDQATRLDKIVTAGQHLLELINSILDLSKIEAGKFAIDESVVSVESIVANVTSILAEPARSKKINLVSAKSVLPHPLLGDSARLQQALLNYATNAIKFTESGGSVTLRVKVIEDHSDSALLRFEVQDTGIGIAAGTLPKLFASFEQADNSTTRKYGGTGLGLAITKRLALLMGGEAGAESVLGAGSTFWFTARLKKGVADSSHPHVFIPDTERQLRKRYAGYRILVIDDEIVNREVAQALLEDVGLIVDTAENGSDAVLKARNTAYAAIFMDMQMPVMDGLAATKILREIPACQKTPIIAMTANAFAEDRQRCLDAGMNDFLAKPFEPDNLYAMTLKWIGQTDG